MEHNFGTSYTNSSSKNGETEGKTPEDDDSNDHEKSEEEIEEETINSLELELERIKHLKDKLIEF